MEYVEVEGIEICEAAEQTMAEYYEYVAIRSFVFWGAMRKAKKYRDIAEVQAEAIYGELE